MKDIHIEEVRVSAAAGTTMYPALREALILALTEERTVILTFNDKDYKLVPREIFKWIAP